MDNIKSLDYSKVISAMLHDVARITQLDAVSDRSVRLDCQKVKDRIQSEGLGFLTKTLPSLGKALDKALSGGEPLNAASLGFEPQPGSNLPLFCGGLFNTVLASDGTCLPDASTGNVRHLRQILYLFYKYELPYSPQQEQEVLDQFVKTEEAIAPFDEMFMKLSEQFDNDDSNFDDSFKCRNFAVIIRRAKALLKRVLCNVSHLEINPRHGPGAVSTREQYQEKYMFRNVPERITNIWPFDAYFCASGGHVCDTYQDFSSLGCVESPARVILVPKDSRGPRLISCEPLYLQWIQQGIMTVIVRKVEHHPLSRDNVHFTDQRPNQLGALSGSIDGKYATLDLKEASDRVTCGLVHLLFPEPLRSGLLGSRSLSTSLPNGSNISLRKFAPMGSALCFPVMALTIWALLSSAVTDEHTKERVLVYGDDVIVPNQYSGYAIELLEAFGLAINRAKSCTSGLFRESCGLDAFRGVEVTPVRFRTVWSSEPCPSAYVSWIAYANSMYKRGYSECYDYIVDRLLAIYTLIPESQDPHPRYPALLSVPEQNRPTKSRINPHLQRREVYVRTIRSIGIKRELPGWNKLLRYFAEHPSHRISSFADSHSRSDVLIKDFQVQPSTSASSYTRRRATKFAYRWH